MTDVTGVSSVNTYAATNPDNIKKTAEDTTAKESTVAAEDSGVVYEKSKATEKDSANQIYNKDAIVSKLKLDQQNRIASMQSLVQKLLTKSVGESMGFEDLFNIDGLSDEELSGKNLAKTFREAAALASPEDIMQAKADVAEDGYWGVNQTSDRMVSMAIALTGGDTSKADEMMAAIEKGYEIATKAWGEELPQISKDTLEATREKLTAWKNGETTAEDYTKYFS